MVKVKSVSNEGTYYLVNGWRRHKAFWVKRGDTPMCLFKDARTAKMSLTKLLKTMPDYASDSFIIEEV